MNGELHRPQRAFSYSRWLMTKEQENNECEYVLK